MRLAYDNFDANAAGKDLPPLMILHGLFGSKRNLRVGEDVQQSNWTTGKLLFSGCIGYEKMCSVIGWKLTTNQR